MSSITVKAAHTALIFLLMLSVSLAAGITECGTLASNGTTYNLINNITATNTTCLSITANNITIDCGGYTIDQQNNSYYAIYSSNAVKGLTVQNCDIIGTNGIYLSNGRLNWDDYPDGNKDMTIQNNNFTLTGNAIFDYNPRSTLTISGNIINITSSNGIYLYNVKANADLTDNMINANSTAYGIHTYWSVEGDLDITDSAINTPFGTAIYFEQTQQGNHITVSNAEISASVGIRSYNTATPLIENSNINATYHGYERSGDPSSIHIDNSNITMTGSGSGIYCGDAYSLNLYFHDSKLTTENGYCFEPASSGYSCSIAEIDNSIILSSGNTCMYNVNRFTINDSVITYGGTDTFGFKTAFATTYGNYLTNNTINSTATNGIDYVSGYNSNVPTLNRIKLESCDFTLVMEDLEKAYNFTSLSNLSVDPERSDTSDYINLTVQDGFEGNLTMYYEGSPANEADLRLFQYDGISWKLTQNSSVNTTTKAVRGQTDGSGEYAILGNWNSSSSNIYLYSPSNNTVLCESNTTNMIFSFITPNFTWAYCGYYFSDLGEFAGSVLILNPERYDNFTVNDTHSFNISVPIGSHQMSAFCANLYPDNTTFLVGTAAINITYSTVCAFEDEPNVDQISTLIDMFIGDVAVFKIIFALAATCLVVWFVYGFAGQYGGLIAGLFMVSLCSFILALIPAWLGVFAIISGIIGLAITKR